MTEREALGEGWVANRFRGHLEGVEVDIFRDQRLLEWLMWLKSPTGGLARSALALQAYNLLIEYTPGWTNVVADTLSHPPTTEATCPLCIVNITLPAVPAEDIRYKQIEDEGLKEIMNALVTMNNSVDLVNRSHREYIMNNGILYKYSPKLYEEQPHRVALNSQISGVLYQYHDSPLLGH